jgi:hypothetical protein
MLLPVEPLAGLARRVNALQAGWVVEWASLQFSIVRLTSALIRTAVQNGHRHDNAMSCCRRARLCRGADAPACKSSRIRATASACFPASTPHGFPAGLLHEKLVAWVSEPIDALSASNACLRIEELNLDCRSQHYKRILVFVFGMTLPR